MNLKRDNVIEVNVTNANTSGNGTEGNDDKKEDSEVKIEYEESPASPYSYKYRLEGADTKVLKKVYYKDTECKVPDVNKKK